MRAPTSALLAVTVLLSTGLALPASAGTSPAPTRYQPVQAGPVPTPSVDGEKAVTYTVPTRHGPLALNVVHPTHGGAILRAHGILTMTPYSALGRNGDKSTWVPRGYARMTADVVGTGDSGGCYDYGGKREQESGYDVVQWIAKQPWSLGRVGMRGGSYDGTTATATAITRPPALATIVPEAAISRWYDYAYSGGLRYTLNNETLGQQGPLAVTDEGLDTPLAFDFGLATPPPTDVTKPGYQERLTATQVVCDEVQHLSKGYDTSPDYDAFWKERDYAAVASRITIPVLVVHNWGDWNVKQDTGYRLFNALTRSPQKRMFFGTRWDGHGTPGGTYKATIVAWMDRWVAGIQNGIEQSLPTITSQTSTDAGPGAFLTSATPGTQDVQLNASAAFTLGTGASVGAATAPVAITGTGTENAALAALAPGGHQSHVVMQTAPLTRDVRIFGSPTVRLSVDSGRTWLTLAVSIVDLAPGATSADVAVTRGWLDTRYERGLDAQRPGKAGARTDEVTLKPMDYTFTRGHRIAFVVAGEAAEWVIPQAYDGAPCATCSGFTLRVGSGTSLRLPVVGGGKGAFG